jgi:1-aminocyclopropane-1-carboxylate deaminase/D-cysteine desulfhydrase-like pyridoxal-dependent ACC family enzyme
MADPREDFHWESIETKDPVICESQEDIVSGLENLKLTPNFTCSYCGSGFTQAGYLKRHVEMKYESKVGPECVECGKLFANPKTLEKHMKTHLKCNTCKQEFETTEDAARHKKEHTFCKVCQKDFKFVSKLTKHISSMH